jgi:hypothetical protein
VRCLSFFFCRLSQLSLLLASAVIVVVKLNREEGRPDSEKVERLGVRKKERVGDAEEEKGKGLWGGDRMVSSFSGW